MPRFDRMSQTMAKAGASRMMKAGLKKPICEACISTPSNDVSTLRSVNRVMDVPACSNSVQNTTDTAVSKRTTIIRSRSTLVHFARAYQTMPSTAAPAASASRPPTRSRHCINHHAATTATRLAA